MRGRPRVIREQTGDNVHSPEAHLAENPIGRSNPKVSASSPQQMNGTITDRELTPTRVLSSYASIVDTN